MNPAEGWHCLTIAVPSDLAEVVSAWCFDLGSCGLQVEEEGECARLSAYFAADLELAAICCRRQMRRRNEWIAMAALRVA
ncbi:MAG: hypothetical protein HYW07_19455 [Candidatus Latescibacteria bacterium]|nr:hypothetical protein [Candidatus Latescibacterota bacterium]